MASPKKFYIASRGVFNFHAEGDVVGWNRSSRGGLAEFFCRYLLDIYWRPEINVHVFNSF